ncbi:MAG: uncharacterized protein JWP08_1510 [Bryobacterales bacterium]|nr:uncharacterized protein [Bryobacterales bacterium]
MKEADSAFRRLGVADALARNPGLSVRPTHDARIILEGEIAFRVIGPDHRELHDAYSIALHVPETFPAVAATVFELGHRIARDFHKLDDGSLCLGAPIAVRLTLVDEPTVNGLVDRLVVPYLYGHTFFLQTGLMPFGELAHGKKGLRRQFVDMFGLQDEELAHSLASVASLRRRVANKKSCPCGSGNRFGRCHHRVANLLRKKLGRSWLRHSAVMFS